MKFHIILKGRYIYFFLHENAPKYYFFVDIAETLIKIYSTEIEVINSDKKKKVCLYMYDKPTHILWSKSIKLYLSKISQSQVNELPEL